MCIHKKKPGHSMCRECYLGTEEYNKEKSRLKKVRTERNNRIRYKSKKRFTCEMGYADCELRKFCNGDC
jgi:hypothetical protein